jgi:hypothetical protein
VAEGELIERGGRLGGAENDPLPLPHSNWEAEVGSPSKSANNAPSIAVLTLVGVDIHIESIIAHENTSAQGLPTCYQHFGIAASWAA